MRDAFGPYSGDQGRQRTALGRLGSQLSGRCRLEVVDGLARHRLVHDRKLLPTLPASINMDRLATPLGERPSKGTVQRKSLAARAYLREDARLGDAPVQLAQLRV